MKLKDMTSKADREKAWLGYLVRLTDDNLVKSDRVALQKEAAAELGVDYRTVARHVEDYRKEGAKSLERERSPRPDAKKVSGETLKAAIKLRKEVPGRSVKDIIMIMESNGTVATGTVARSTLQRELEEAGYSKKQMRMYTPNGTESAARFQKEHPNELWQGDVKDGPYINGEKTYFICWIDDCSRFVVHGGFYFSQDAASVADCLRKAIEGCGRPKQLYVDNGPAYVSKHLEGICMKLGIVLSRCKPAHPSSKGKIERFNLEMEKFLAEARREGAKSIEELNGLYTIWETEYYHKAKHSSLKNETPHDTYYAAAATFRYVDKDALDETFDSKIVERRVTKAGTISFEGDDSWQVENLALCGRKVIVVASKNSPDRLRVMKKGFPDCFATRVQIGPHVDYEKRALDADHRLPEEEAVPEDTGSSMFAVLKARYESGHPGTTVVDDLRKAKMESAVGTAPRTLTKISYRDKEDE